MKAIAYQQALPITDALALQDVTLPAPQPGPHDLLVDVQAIAVNPVDTKVRASTSAEPGQWKVLGWDAVGLVREVGAQVRLFRPGDRVWYAGAINRPGANAQQHVVDERIAAHAPRLPGRCRRRSAAVDRHHRLGDAVSPPGRAVAAPRGPVPRARRACARKACRTCWACPGSRGTWARRPARCW